MSNPDLGGRFAACIGDLPDEGIKDCHFGKTAVAWLAYEEKLTGWIHLKEKRGSK
jgi:hypothetical protein